MKKELLKINHAFFSMLKKLDTFGKPVGLKFNGEETYKTSYGGFITVGFYIWMIYVAV